MPIYKRCYILLVNWNGWRDTIECLESLLRLDYPDFRVIVCDNGSTDGSLRHIKSWAEGYETLPDDSQRKPFPQKSPYITKPVSVAEYSLEEVRDDSLVVDDKWLTLIDCGSNLGFAGGNNVGLRFLSGCPDWDAVWMLNNDAVVAPESLAALVNRLSAEPAPGICGSTLLYYHDPEKVQALAGGYYCKWVGLPWLSGRFRKFTPGRAERNAARIERHINYVMGASMLVSRAFIQQIGLMSEEYFLFFEETDWAWRGRNKFLLGYAPRSLVYHKGGGSIGTSSNPFKKSLICDYYALRNRLVFSRRHCREALATIYLSLVGALFLRICCGRWQNAAIIRDILLGRAHQWDERFRSGLWPSEIDIV